MGMLSIGEQYGVIYRNGRVIYDEKLYKIIKESFEKAFSEDEVIETCDNPPY